MVRATSGPLPLRRHPALAELPFILETPNDDAGYAQEIAWLRAAQK